MTGTEDLRGEAPQQDEHTIIAERRAKLGRLREAGVAFPNDFRPAHHSVDLVTHHDMKTREQLELERVTVRIGSSTRGEHPAVFSFRCRRSPAPGSGRRS